MRRRICWPSPDKICMEGGCIHCDDSDKSMTKTALRKYAVAQGMLDEFEDSLVNGTNRWER